MAIQWVLNQQATRQHLWDDSSRVMSAFAYNWSVCNSAAVDPDDLKYAYDRTAPNALPSIEFCLLCMKWLAKHPDTRIEVGTNEHSE